MQPPLSSPLTSIPWWQRRWPLHALLLSAAIVLPIYILVRASGADALTFDIITDVWSPRAIRHILLLTGWQFLSFWSYRSIRRRAGSSWPPLARYQFLLSALMLGVISAVSSNMEGGWYTAVTSLSFYVDALFSILMMYPVALWITYAYRRFGEYVLKNLQDPSGEELERIRNRNSPPSNNQQP